MSDWAFYEEYGNISSSNVSSNGNVLKLSVTSNQSGDTWASYSLPLTMTTKNMFISFRYRVDNPYTWFTIVLDGPSQNYLFYQGHLSDEEFTTKTFSLPDNLLLSRVEVVVETTSNAPAGTTAVAYLDHIEISPWPYSGQDVFPSLFVSSLQTRYATVSVDDALALDLGPYLHNTNKSC